MAKTTKKLTVRTYRKSKKSLSPKELAIVRKERQAYYLKNREHILTYANNYYAEHKEIVLEKAKVRYAKKRKDYFCVECGKKFPREISGHHLYCAKCSKAKVRKRKPTPSKKAK